MPEIPKPVIRMATPADAPAIAAVYAPYVTDAVTSFESEPPSPDAMRERLENTLTTLPWLVLTRAPLHDHGEGSGSRDHAEAHGEREVVGYAYASPHSARAAYRWSVDVSVYLDAAAQGRGYGRLLYIALLEILRAQGYVNAFAGVALPNPASVGLHEAMGFTPAGVRHRIGFKHGRWIDVGDWEMPLVPHPAQQPPEPVPWSALPPETLRKTIAYP